MFDFIDIPVLQFLNGLAGRYPVFEAAWQTLADWRFMRCAPIVAFLAWAWIARAQTGARMAIVTGLIGLCAVNFATQLLKHAVQLHPRPFAVADQLHLVLPRGITTNWGLWSSFPSDTTALHMALVAIIWSISRRAGMAAFAWVALFIALPRVFFLYHYPSDVVAGALIGLAFVWAAQRLWAVSVLAAATLRCEREWPQAFYPIALIFACDVMHSFDSIERVFIYAKKLVHAT